jgi:phage RecT family recombinase
MSDKNQNEGEFFAVVATGRRGLEDMAAKMGGEIMAIAAEPVRKAGSTWMQRAIVSIANNDNLKDVLASKAGLFSVYKALAKGATMGLQIGGQFPHAHLTPYQGKVELIVSAEGYKHAAVNGPGAVLSSVDVRRVYEGEAVRIDVGGAKVDHVIDPTKERGKLVGVYGIMVRTDGSRAVDYMTRAEALAIRDSHSSAYRNRKGPWLSDEDAMIEKTAAKKFLRKYAAEAEGLAMIYGQDSDDVGVVDYQPAPRDVSDRMAGHLDAKVEKAAAAPAKVKPAPEQAAAAETVEDVPEGEQGDAPAELF